MFVATTNEKNLNGLANAGAGNVAGYRRLRLGYGRILSALAAVALTASVASAQSVRVSVKVVTDEFGSRNPQGFYVTDQQIQGAITQANAALTNMGADWQLNLSEIVEVNTPQFFWMGCEGLPQLEQAATGNPGMYQWRDNAINMYVVNIDPQSGCGGACSFPNGISGSREAIIINNLGIGNDGIGWLHEIGHYFGLWHSFQCMQNGQPCFESDLNVCTGAGGIDRMCPDTCPDHSNVMSYHEGINEFNATFSRCQLDVIAGQMATSRTVVLDGGTPGTPDPQPQPGNDDSYEENDTPDSAKQISAGSYQLVCNDEDWFVIDSDGTIDIRISGTGGDLDLGVFDPNSGELLASSEQDGSEEAVQKQVQPGQYVVLVLPYNGMTASYSMTIGGNAGTPQPDPQPQPGNDDSYEENDTPETAKPIATGTYELNGLDEDWFVANVDCDGPMSVHISGPTGDLDLVCFDPTTGEAIAVSEAEGSQEAISVEAREGTYFFLVSPYQGMTSTYTMTVNLPTLDGGQDPHPPTPQPEPQPQPGSDDQFEENDSPETATQIDSGTYQLHGNDDDWFVVQVGGDGTLALAVQGNAGDLDLILFDSSSNSNEPMAVSANEGSMEQLEVDVRAGVAYYALVTPYEGQTSAYTLTVNAPGSGNPNPNPQPEPQPQPGNDDQYEENDTPESATPIQSGTFQLFGGDEDWFVANVTAGGTISVQIAGNGGDLDLGLFDSNGQLLASSEQEGSNESVQSDVQAGTYFVLVTPYQGNTAAYTMIVTIPGSVGQPQPQPEPQPFPQPQPGQPGPVIGGDVEVNVDEINVPINAPCGMGAPAAMGLSLLGLVGFMGINRPRRLRARG